MDATEGKSLLLDFKDEDIPLQTTQILSSVQCFKIQYEYLTSTLWQKRRVIHQLHSRKYVHATVYIVIYCYLISSLFSVIHTIFWLI